jgi:hypothetical protein
VSPDVYRSEREALVEAVTTGHASLAPAVRQAIVDRAAGRPPSTAIPKELVGFVDQVAGDRTAISDDDVLQLLATGLDEEAVFEAIVSGALGASHVRLERVDVLLDPGS